jgi:CMP-N-acetylneuraminic acid synthetase
MNDKTAIVMPLKAQSERVKDKNFRPLGGVPLYRWALDKLLMLGPDVFLYGDNDMWDCVCPCPHITGRVQHLYEHFSAQTGDSNDFFQNIALALPDHYERIVYANSTSPFVELNTYQICLNEFHYSPEYDSVVSAVSVYGRVWNNAAQSTNHDPKTCPRTQHQEPVWIESDAFWMIDRNLIINHHRRVGMCPYFYPMSNLEQIDINMPEDFDFAESVLPHVIRRGA